MNPWRWVDPRIQKVRVANVQSYFLRRGWSLQPNPNPNLLRFEQRARGNGPPLFQMIPASEKFADFRQGLAELITTLSEDVAAAVFEYLDFNTQEQLLAVLPEPIVARVINDMAPDDRTALLMGISATRVRNAERIAQALDAARAEPVRTQITDAMKVYERDVLKDVTWHP